jgi:uncharacterized membrane protein
MPWMRRLQLAAVAVAIVAYSLLSHYSNSHAQERDLATALALAPMLALGALALWRAAGLIIMLIAFALCSMALYVCFEALEKNFPLLYFIQQAGFYGAMALTFGLTLIRPRVPLCTVLADKVHGPLSAAEIVYTRAVTAAWTLFFVVNLIATLLLFEFAPLRVWSIFVNFCSLPLVLAMFVGEYVVRRRVLPQVHGGGLIATLRVYFANPR